MSDNGVCWADTVLWKFCP